MANSKFILPLFYKELNDATASWSDEEFGAYMRLLIHQWSIGELPKDMNRLKRIAESVEKNWHLLGKKFIETNTGLKNKVMENVRNERQEFYKRQFQNGSKGGNPNFKKGAKNPYYSKDNPKITQTEVIFLDEKSTQSKNEEKSTSSEKKITQDNPEDNQDGHLEENNSLNGEDNLKITDHITDHITEKIVIFSKNEEKSTSSEKKITQDNPNHNQDDYPSDYPSDYPKDNPLTLTLTTPLTLTSNNNCLFEKIKKFFGFDSEQKHVSKWFDINAFLKKLSEENKIEHFEHQFEFYEKYKNESGEKIHSFQSFINDGWDAENWEFKLNSIKKTDKKQHNSANPSDKKNRSITAKDNHRLESETGNYEENNK